MSNISLNSSLRISTTALQTNQLALGTISHNISNVNTDGYTRQIVQIASDSRGGFGTGSMVSGVVRQVDRVLLSRITAQSAEVGYTDTRRTQLQNIETLYGQGDSSLEKITNSFFEELNVLSNQTDSSAQRLNVVQKATLLTETLNSISSELTATATDIDRQIDSEITQLNTVLRQIYELNEEIMRVETAAVSGSNTNDLRDKQQGLIDDLADSLKINVVPESSGRLRIFTENGRRLVDESGYVQLTRESSGGSYQNISVRSILSDGSLSASSLELNFNTISGGSLKALVEMRDTTIPALDAELDELANTIITEFNKVHSRGSSVPPQNTLTSGVRDGSISNTTSDLFTEIGATLQNASFDLSVVNKATGQVVSTTLAAAGGAGPITLPGSGPFSLADLETLIEANADVAGDLTVDVATDSEGNPYISISATNGAYGVVLANNAGDPLGDLEMNRFFTGTDASNIAVRSDIATTPAGIATAKMRTNDGGLSSLDNRNILDLANLASTSVAFDAAGGLPGMNQSISGYAIQIISSFAVNLQDSSDRLEFAEAVLNDMTDRSASLSGVNLDEELSNLLLYQNAFQASARVVQTVDEMMEAIINVIR